LITICSRRRRFTLAQTAQKRDPGHEADGESGECRLSSTLSWSGHHYGGADKQIAGVVALAPGDEPDALDMNKLFVEPRHIRGGVGRALLSCTPSPRLVGAAPSG
jgi:hypothetical protein